MLKNGLKYITFVQRRLFSPVLLKTVCLFIVLIFFAMLSIQIEEIKGNLLKYFYQFYLFRILVSMSIQCELTLSAE